MRDVYEVIRELTRTAKPTCSKRSGSQVSEYMTLANINSGYDIERVIEAVAYHERVAGYLDLGAMIALPLCYMIVVIVYFNRFGTMMAVEEVENTKVVHVAPEDF